MDNQETHSGEHIAMKCTNGPEQGNSNSQQSIKPKLMRVSEIDRDYPPTSSLSCVLDWVRGFLACAHPQLGRKGSVCPFVPVSLQMDSIWMAEVVEENPVFESISEIITEYRDVFMTTEPTSGPDAMHKAFLVVFPSLAASGIDGAALVDKVQYSLKKSFVDRGLMLGEFHAANESPGLRNPDFRPLRSPVPMLAIRHMVESDLPFLIRESYPANERSSFLRSYLFRLGGTLSPSRFDQALDGLVVAGVEVWIANASTMFRARRRAEEQSMRMAP